MSDNTTNTEDAKSPAEKKSRRRSFKAAFAESPKLFDGIECAPNFTKVRNTDEFFEVLESNKLCVLMATCDTSEPSVQMRGIVNIFAGKLPNVLFMEADMEKNLDLTKTQKIVSIPTFVIYKDGLPIDRIDGAFPEKLKASLFKVTGEEINWTNKSNEMPRDSEDLIHYINLKKSECFNSSNNTQFEDFIARKSRLVSDCDEELILSYGFNQDVMLQCFKMKAPSDKGPKLIRVFINQLTSADFDAVKTMESIQEFGLTEEDLSGQKMIEFDKWKFKKVTNVLFYISCNQGGDDVTEITELTLYGSPVNKMKGLSGRTVEFVTL